MTAGDTFEGYVPKTNDPGIFVVLAAIGFSIVSNSLLPCFISLGRRYEKKRIESQEKSHRQNEERVYHTDDGDAVGHKEESGSSVPSSFIHGRGESSTNQSWTGNRSHPRTLQSVVDKVIMPPYPDDADISVLGGAAFVGAKQRRADAQSVMSGVSSAINSAVSSNASKATTTILDASAAKGRSRARRQRHVLLDNALRSTEAERERQAERQRYKKRQLASGEIVGEIVKIDRRGRKPSQDKRKKTGKKKRKGSGSKSGSELSSIERDTKAENKNALLSGSQLSDGSGSKRNKGSDSFGLRRVHNSDSDFVEKASAESWWLPNILSEIGKLVTPLGSVRGDDTSNKDSSDSGSRADSRATGSFHTTRSRRSKRRSRSPGASSVDSVFSRRHPSPDRSVMSPLDDNAISPNDAADAHDPGYSNLPRKVKEDENEENLCCDPTEIRSGFRRMVKLSQWDFEMRRIFKLAVPYSISALLEGIFEVVSVGLIAHFLGTDAVAAYSIVDLLLGLTVEFFGGILAAEGTLCSHAVGAENYVLAGQYVQLSAIFYTICLVPNIFFWMLFLDDAIRLFGFEESVVDIGYRYGIIVLFHDWLEGMGYAYHSLLDVIDYEDWSTIMSVSEGFVDVVAILVVLLLRETSLQEIALIELGISILFFLFNCWYTVARGWVNDYLDGMVGTVAITNQRAVMSLLNTAMPLAFGSLLQYGEWEILTIFAAAMGPAEVTAWGILGSLWEAFETAIEGIADAGEVRCAFHLGAGHPMKAKVSSYKTIIIGVFSSIFFTSILFFFGDDVAVWFTPDPTLQRLIAQVLPMLGVGNIFLGAGLISWALVGAQGRYRLATLVGFVSTWTVTIPLAAVLVYGFNLNLNAIAAAVVIGYSFDGTVLLYILLRSDWDRLSKCLVEANAESDSESDSDSSSSSSCAMEQSNAWSRLSGSRASKSSRMSRSITSRTSTSAGSRRTRRLRNSTGK